MMSVPYICDLSLIVLLSGSLEIPQHRLAVTGKHFKLINFIYTWFIHFTTHLKNCLESDISAQLFSVRLAIHLVALKLIIDCNSRIVYFKHTLYTY